MKNKSLHDFTKLQLQHVLQYLMKLYQQKYHQEYNSTTLETVNNLRNDCKDIKTTIRLSETWNKLLKIAEVMKPLEPGEIPSGKVKAFIYRTIHNLDKDEK